MSYITLGKNQSVQGFNNYRLGSLRSQGNGSMFYNNSIYGSGSRVGTGSRFRSYNMGPVGTYYQMPEPEPPKDNFWKGFLKAVGGAALGIGVSWLASGDNASKAFNWISDLFGGDKSNSSSNATNAETTESNGD